MIRCLSQSRGGTGRSELDEAQRVGDLVVVVGFEPYLVNVERLCAIDVSYRNGDELELEIQGALPPRGPKSTFGA